MAWHFAPESVGSNWRSETLSGSKPPASSSGTPSLPRRSWLAWLTARSRVLPSGTTCEPSTLAHGVAAWIGSLPVTRANRSASPANEPEPQTLGTCGPTCDGASKIPASESCSSRTCRGTYRLGSPTFLPILPRSGSMRSGACSERTTLELHTAGNGSGCWPTPTAADSKGSGSAGYPVTATRNAGTTLTDATVRLRDWPTPRATDGSHGGPNARGSKGDLQLPSAAGLLHPTTEPDGSGSPPKLNPRFVESLMGFPLGWTDFAPLETPSSPLAPPLPSDCSTPAH